MWSPRHIIVILLLTIFVCVNILTTDAVSPLKYRSTPSTFDDPIIEFIAEIDCQSQEYNFCRPHLEYQFTLFRDHPTIYCTTSSVAKITWLDDKFNPIAEDIIVELHGSKSESRISPKLSTDDIIPNNLSPDIKTLIVYIYIESQNPCSSDDKNVPRQITDLATFEMIDPSTIPVPYTELVKIATSTAPPILKFRDNHDKNSTNIYFDSPPRSIFSIGQRETISNRVEPDNNNNDNNSNDQDITVRNIISFEAVFPPVDEYFFSQNFTRVHVIPTGLIQSLQANDSFPWESFTCSLGDPDSTTSPVKAFKRGEERSKNIVFNTTRWLYTPSLQPNHLDYYNDYSLLDNSLHKDNDDDVVDIYGARAMGFVLRCEAIVKDTIKINPHVYKYPGFIVEFRSFNDVNIAAMRFSSQHPTNPMNFFNFNTIMSSQSPRQGLINNQFHHHTLPDNYNDNNSSNNNNNTRPMIIPTGPFFDVIMTKSFPTIKNWPLQIRPATTYIVWHFTQRLEIITSQLTDSVVYIDPKKPLSEFPPMSTQRLLLEIVSPDLRHSNVNHQPRDMEYTITCTLKNNITIPIMAGIFDVRDSWFPPKPSKKQQYEVYPRLIADINPKNEFIYTATTNNYTIGDCMGNFFITIEGKIDTHHKRRSSNAAATAARKEIGLYLSTTHHYHEQTYTQTTEMVTYSHHDVVTRDAIIADNEQFHLVTTEHRNNQDYLVFNITVNTKKLEHDLFQPIFSISTPRYVFLNTDALLTNNDNNTIITKPKQCMLKSYSPDEVKNVNAWANVDVAMVSPTFIQLLNVTFEKNSDPSSYNVYHFSCPSIVLTKVTTDGGTSHTHDDIAYDDIVISLEIEQNITNNQLFTTVWVTTDNRIPLMYFMTGGILLLGSILTVVVLCTVRRGTKKHQNEMRERLLLTEASVNQQITWLEYDTDYNTSNNQLQIITPVEYTVDSSPDENTTTTLGALGNKSNTTGGITTTTTTANNNNNTNTQDVTDTVFVVYKSKKSNINENNDNINTNDKGNKSSKTISTQKTTQKTTKNNNNGKPFVGGTKKVDNNNVKHTQEKHISTPIQTSQEIDPNNHNNISQFDLDLNTDATHTTSTISIPISQPNPTNLATMLNTNTIPSLPGSYSRRTSLSDVKPAVGSFTTPTPGSYNNNTHIPSSLPRNGSFSNNGGVIGLPHSNSFSNIVQNTPLSPQKSNNTGQSSPVLRQLSSGPVSTNGPVIEHDYFDLSNATPIQTTTTTHNANSHVNKHDDGTNSGIY